MKQLPILAPVWKLLALIILCTTSFLVYYWPYYLVSILATFSISYFTRIPYKALLGPIRSSFYLSILLFTMHAIWGNYVDGIKVILRLYNILLFASWVLLTTPYLAIIEGLSFLFKPLVYVGLDATKVSLACTLAIRFMPSIMDIFTQVKTAQKAKGIDKNFIAILIPSIIQTIKMANEIAEAIKARGWD